MRQENRHRVTLLSHLSQMSSWVWFHNYLYVCNPGTYSLVEWTACPSISMQILIKSLCEKRRHRNLCETDLFPMSANKARSMANLFSLSLWTKAEAMSSTVLSSPPQIHLSNGSAGNWENLAAHSMYTSSMPTDMLVCHNAVWKGVIPCSWVSENLILIGGCDRQPCHGAALWLCVHLDWLLTPGTIKRALHYNWWCFNWLPIYPLCFV